MDASRPSIRCCHTVHQGTRGSPPQSYTAGGERTSNNLESYREFRGAHLWMPQVSPTDEPLAGASNLRTRAQGKLTDGQDAEEGGARYEQSGSREQAAKNMSAAVHERTCVVARREAGGPIINQGNIACQLCQERDSDVCLFWAKSQHPSIQLLTF